MSDADREEMLKGMAANRGCRLVKSRRRTPGVGDYGRYGLKDAATGREVFGFGRDGLTATPEEIEAHLRGGMVADWKTSLEESGKAPRSAAPRKKRASSPPPPSTPPPPPPPSPPPPPPLVIREARAGDAGAIGGLIGELGFEAAADALETRLAALKRAKTPALVADQEGVIGCLTWSVMSVLHRPTPVGRISMLVVTEDERRRGIGEKLVAEAEERVAARGCALIEVTSNIELGRAHQFYRRLGFERTSYRFVKTLDPD